MNQPSTNASTAELAEMRNKPAFIPDPRPGFVCGTVIWFGDDRGYGYIRPQGGREPAPGEKHGKDDIYVHFCQIVAPGFRSLKAGDVVEFKIGPSSRYAGKTEAREVRVIAEGER